MMTILHSHQPVDPLLTCKEAAGLLTISVPSFYRRVREGTLPAPIKMGALSRWVHSEILQAIETAKAARKDD